MFEYVNDALPLLPQTRSIVMFCDFDLRIERVEFESSNIPTPPLSR